MEKLVLGVFKYLHGILVGGLIFKMFYGWFVLPVFTELPQVSFLQAVGLSSFVYLFNVVRVHEIEMLKEYEESDMVKYGTYILPWVLLGMGYTTHLIISLFS